MTADKRQPPKTEKCPTCGGVAKLDERRYAENRMVAYSCREGLSHYFFDSDPSLEVRRLRSELDRARKVVEAARDLPIYKGPEDEWHCSGFVTDLVRALAAYDAPTENKNG